MRYGRGRSGAQGLSVSGVWGGASDPGRLVPSRRPWGLAGTPSPPVNDPRPIRTRVFAEIQSAQIQVDAVALQKRKTYPHIAANEGYFYQLAWHLLFKHVAPRRCQAHDDLLLVAASLGTATRKTRFRNAMNGVVQQHNVCRSVAIGFWQAATHPCLQVADYCGWAIQRWKERGDAGSYNLIQPKTASVFEPFAANRTNYY